MESLITTQSLERLTEFVGIARKDPKAEVECKLLSGYIKTKDVADRMMKSILTLIVGAPTDETRLTLSYKDGTRVHVYDGPNVQKVCATNSFRGIPLEVEKKTRYFENDAGKQDWIDVSDARAKFTIRTESPVRKDWDGSPSDPNAHIRIVNRKSFKTPDELFQIDFSMVRTRTSKNQTARDVLKQQPEYELEIEFRNKTTNSEPAEIVRSYMNVIAQLLRAYQESPFLLGASDIQRYEQEFKMSNIMFYDVVTLLRRHLNRERPHNILKGYTVTNKADGERSGLYVARDRKVLKISKNFITWTGITALGDTHVGDFVDGEYIPDKQLFCIFDVYRYRNRDVKSLPLMKTDEDTTTTSRLGCARAFVEDLRTQFKSEPTLTPLRVETKLFLAGDGQAMEEAIQTMLKTKFDYETDGLIFTPRSTGVAPTDDRKGKTWLRVYKWKPPQQNSIDFLVKFVEGDAYDPILQDKAKKGELFVSRSPGDDVIYPRETMTGEYVPKKLPSDLQKIADMNTRIPSVFQPSAPRDPDAYQIVIPMKGPHAVDKGGNKVEDNTIVECSYNTDNNRWEVMRTRYDKTYQYRVLREPQYGNDIRTADSIWTSIHIPVSEYMISNLYSDPADDTMEDDLYYRDDLKRSTRIFNDVYDFHNRIKDSLYKSNVKAGDTLLELAVGRAGDLLKWKQIKPSKVVGVDYSLGNLISPLQGACARYMKEKKSHPYDYLPPTLFVQADMTLPLYSQEDKYLAILDGREQPTTKYLNQFEGLKKFDAVSCQFAIHYACETEETFRAFAENLKSHGKGVFFGTCLDGASVYSMLVGKKTQLLGSGTQICCEFTKQYDDKESWVEEFGMPIKVFLESFERPEQEYLVPFGKVTEILGEYGFELVDSKLFNEFYAQQTKIVLTQEQQTFSFLHRGFVFRRMNKAEKEEHAEKVEEEKKEAELDSKKDEELKEEATKTIEVEAPPKRRKLRLKKPEEEGPPPVLFDGAGADKGEFESFSNMAEYPIDMDGEKFQTVEHYYQAMKAKEFGDTENYDKIIKTKTAKAVKAIGKKVKNFVKETWDARKDEIMFKAVRAKFVQHPELRRKLLDTADRIIGKADARNTYWGIGTAMTSEKSKVPSKWRGQNKLGKMMMDLRTEFREESSS